MRNKPILLDDLAIRIQHSTFTQIEIRDKVLGVNNRVIEIDFWQKFEF